MANETVASTSAVVDAADAGYGKGLKGRHIQMIAIGGSIGTGLFLGAGGRIAQGGPALAISYALCGAIAYIMVRALGELSVRRPSSGAFVSYAREFQGEKGAYATGWLFFLDWCTTVMADITAIALYLHFWPAIQGIPQWLLATIALVLVLLLNLASVQAFGEAEFWLAIIKVGAILIFMAVAIWAIVTGQSVGMHTAGVHNLTESGGFLPLGLLPIVTLSLGVIYAFGGTEMVGVAAGETEEAKKVLPKAINSMIIRIAFFYVGSVVLMVLVLPWTAYDGQTSPFVTFFEGIGIPYAADIMQVVVLTAAFSSLNAGLYSTGRTLRSLAVAGEAPAFTAKLNRNKVPMNAILFTAGLGLIGVLINYVYPSKAFEIVMNLAGIGIAGTWISILFTHTIFLKRCKAGLEERPSYRAPGAPVTNWIAIITLVGVIISMAFDAEFGRPTLFVFGIVVVLLVIYWFAIRDRIKPVLVGADGETVSDVAGGEVGKAIASDGTADTGESDHGRTTVFGPVSEKGDDHPTT